MEQQMGTSSALPRCENSPMEGCGIESNDHQEKSRMKGNLHVRFGIGGGGGDSIADHNESEYFIRYRT